MKLRYWACLCLFWLFGCSAPSSPSTSLYQQLGEMEGISRIVDGLLVKIEQDPVIVRHFADTDIDRFRSKLIEQLCQLSHGPCQYTGSSMQESHTGFQITKADFDRLVGHLIEVMTSEQIPLSAQNQLLALLAPMYPDVVYR